MMKSNKNLSLRKIGIAAITRLYATKTDMFDDTLQSIRAADKPVDLSLPANPRTFSSHEFAVEFASGGNYRVWSIERGIEFLEKDNSISLLESIARLGYIPSFVIANYWENSDYHSNDEYVIYRLTPKQETEIADTIEKISRVNISRRIARDDDERHAHSN